MEDKIIVGMKEKKCVVPEQKGSEMEDNYEKYKITQKEWLNFLKGIKNFDSIWFSGLDKIDLQHILWFKRESTTDLKKEILEIIENRIEKLKDIQKAEPIDDNLARDDWQDIQKIVKELKEIKKAIEGK